MPFASRPAARRASAGQANTPYVCHLRRGLLGELPKPLRCVRSVTTDTPAVYNCEDSISGVIDTIVHGSSQIIRLPGDSIRHLEFQSTRKLRRPDNLLGYGPGRHAFQLSSA